MKRCFRISMASVAFCCVLFFTNIGVTLAADTIELSFQGTYSENHVVVVKALKPWIKTVKEQTNGRVNITYYPPNSLVPMKDAYTNLVSGLVDMLVEGVMFRPDLFLGYQVTMLPFVSTNAESFVQILPGLTEKFPELTAKIKDTKLLFFLSAAPGELSTTNKLVKNLEDLKGMRIITGDPQAVDVVKELGANPIEMMFTEIYMALQRNSGDGTIFPIPATKALKITEVTMKHTIINLNVGPLFCLMNMDKWNQLPADIQKVFEDTTATLGQKQSRVLDEANAQIINDLKAEGHEVYVLPKDERKRWKEKIMPVIYEKLKKYEERGVPNAKAIYEEAVRLSEK